MYNPSNSQDVNFDDLFHKWNRKVYNYAFSKTSSTFIAEETVQRVFIKLWKNIQLTKVNISIEAQLFVITKSILLDVLKEENRRNVNQNNVHLKKETVYTPLDLYQAKEISSDIINQIDKMPPVRREVFKLSRFEELNYKEIAERLSITTKTVENHINLALKELRRIFSYVHIIFILFYNLF